MNPIDFDARQSAPDEVFIHPLSIVHPKAEIGPGTTIGPFAIVGPHVRIGRDCMIGPHVLLDGKLTLGDRNQVHHGASLGGPPQDLKFKDELSEVIIGSGNTFREYTTVHRGTAATLLTQIGDNSLFMAYVHIAHDCRVGSNLVLANLCEVAGHVELDDRVIIGGVCPVHQFCKIGTMVMVGASSRVTQDIIPYARAVGNPMRMEGLNLVGLRRAGFAAETVSALKKVYTLLFRSGLNTSQAVTRITDEVPMLPEVQIVLDFIERSNRGIVKE